MCIRDSSLSDAQKQDAVAQMVAMTEIAEKETAAETMLASKGFLDSVVSISEDSADVVVNASELTEANRAQIEDIVTRKTGVAAQNIVITPVSVSYTHLDVYKRQYYECAVLVCNVSCLGFKYDLERRKIYICHEWTDGKDGWRSSGRSRCFLEICRT